MKRLNKVARIIIVILHNHMQLFRCLMRQSLLKLKPLALFKYGIHRQALVDVTEYNKVTNNRD